MDLKVEAFASALTLGRACNGSFLRAEPEQNGNQRRVCFSYPVIGEWNGAT